MKPPHTRWTLLALALLIVLLAVGIAIFWHVILLALTGWIFGRIAWRKLVGTSPRRRRGARSDSIRNWIEAGASAAIAWNTRGMRAKPEKIAPRPTPVYRVPSSQVAANDPRWESDDRWPFRGDAR